MHPQAIYFHAFNLFNERIGPVRFKKLIDHFGSLEEAWKNGNAGDFIKAGLEEELSQEIVLKRPQMDFGLELKKLEKENIKILTILDEDYPKLLNEIYSPPHILYVKGSFKPEDEFALAIVGTRRLSMYGKQAACKIAREISQSGMTIVSGLAQGIDTLAHLAAVENKGRTIAVIGSGIDWQSVFPPGNKRLAQMIIENGALVSEYCPGTASLKHHFPARNRIVSGLALGTLVVEAPEKSGALLTARHALDQNREVFAIPGPIFSETSLGPNNLIKIGAKLVTQTSDILDELNLRDLAQNIQAKQILPDTKEEELILALLCDEPIAIDKIIQETKIETALASSTLVLMEMKGKVKNLGGMQYVLAR